MIKLAGCFKVLKGLSVYSKVYIFEEDICLKMNVFILKRNTLS